ncbi:MAG: thioredoxin family protein [Phycisphaeraceae bacterium]|nr:thioredoxin family protein [Phycisphaeraceae bacterium]
MRSIRPVLILCLVVLGFAAWRIYSGRTADVPEAFARYGSLESALEAAADQHRPVVAVVGASWCPACQTYKRSTLASEQVIAAINMHAIGIYIESDHDWASVDTLKRIGAEVEYLPTTLIIRDRGVTASAVGAIGADELIGLINSAPAP